jgi:DNA-binding transcriptional MerR regulator
MATHYRIGEFAELSGVSAKTLRFYDDIGLLAPASVDPRTGYRFYVPQQLPEIASIIAMKELGVPLARLRGLMKKSTTGRERRELLVELKRTVEGSIKTATQSLRWVDAALQELDEVSAPIPVVVKHRPAVFVASIRSKVRAYAEIEQFERELFAALPAQSIGDLRGVLWHRCADSDYLEGEAFVSLKARVPSRSIYDLKELPSATLACAYSGWDDLTSERAYGALRKWMSMRGYRLAGPKREIYLDQLLEIQFPLKLN